MHLKIDTTLDNGKFRIIRVLGQGGFGITYLAHHTILDEKVAIKEFFPKTYCDREETTSHITVGTRSNVELVDKLKRRFIREAKNLRHLNHSGIVRIHDIFAENNTAYYVMDYIEGENLSTLVKKYGKLSEGLAIKYITQIGDALEYMHSKNMTHFDVKPGNIMIRKEDDRPILIDFGLSVQYTEEGDETTTNIGAASPGYSALEMYNTKNLQTFSPETDVYSLAATFYYLITGIVPPSAEELLSSELEFPSHVTYRLREIIKSALRVKSKRTPTIRHFLNELLPSNNSNNNSNSVNPQNFSHPHNEDTIVAEIDNRIKKRVNNTSISKQQKIKNKDDKRPLIIFLAIALIFISISLLSIVGFLGSNSNDYTEVPDTLDVLEIESQEVLADSPYPYDYWESEEIVATDTFVPIEEY